MQVGVGVLGPRELSGDNVKMRLHVVHLGLGTLKGIAKVAHLVLDMGLDLGRERFKNLGDPLVELDVLVCLQLA